MQLSEHFALSEFSTDGPIPDDCLPIFTQLATQILEPTRTFLGRAMDVTSGYRPPAMNAAIHGAPHSEHVATPRYCAADFTFDVNPYPPISLRTCFDWIRTNPVLPFHQVILEHGRDGSSIIHISINLDQSGERQALEGGEYNSTAYSSHDVTPFNPGPGQENA